MHVALRRHVAVEDSVTGDHVGLERARNRRDELANDTRADPTGGRRAGVPTIKPRLSRCGVAPALLAGSRCATRPSGPTLVE
jgi:hypothetical protein